MGSSQNVPSGNDHGSGLVLWIAQEPYHASSAGPRSGLLLRRFRLDVNNVPAENIVEGIHYLEVWHRSTSLNGAPFRKAKAWCWLSGTCGDLLGAKA
jgi:hypothetical protein